MSDGHYEHPARIGFSIGVTRQTDTAMRHAGPASAYGGQADPYFVTRFEQNPGASRAMHPADFRQYQLHHQHSGLLPPVCEAMDPFHVRSWGGSAASWGWAPLATKEMVLPPVASADHWPVGFSPEARVMHPPQLTYTALPSEVTPNIAISPTGPKVTRSVMKLQLYDGAGSLDTFLTKFQRMAM